MVARFHEKIHSHPNFKTASQTEIIKEMGEYVIPRAHHLPEPSLP
jgi:hypothetical protein